MEKEYQKQILTTFLLRYLSELIRKEPVAYDIDKVVQQIKEQDGVCIGCKCPDECNECAIGERINIVKSGGIE